MLAVLLSTKSAVLAVPSLTGTIGVVSWGDLSGSEEIWNELLVVVIVGVVPKPK